MTIAAPPDPNAAPPVAAAPPAVPPAVPPAAPPAAPPAPAAAQPPAAPPAVSGQPKSLLDAVAEPPKAGDPPKPGEPPAKQGAPEKYTDFTLPEGISLDKGLMDKATPLFKKLGLSQEAAQELVSLQAEHAKGAADSVVTQADQIRTQQITSWQEETKKLLGAEWQKELGSAAKALDAFWPPEFRKMLTASGIGDHPLMVQGLVKIGKAIAEAKPGEGSRVPVTDSKEQTNRTMFPKMYDRDGNYIGGSK